MEFALNKEQEMIRKTARDFAENEIGPIAAEIDETTEYPTETVNKLGELGFMANYRWTDRISLYGGYQLMWIEGVALAPEQLDTFTVAGGGPSGIAFGGSPFYHGANGGLQIVF